ncbi:O-antigen ligase family protein [Aliarcobacter skirrowii]|uniref:O-antigen ligase family protein n=1 Tax=Aliarcobacter skirrowii TaxID=28200 RepID=UPI0029BC956A|nr:O-antigen ligase family protein [Aliarcobacter skirrowii]MDX4012948.1 O-antigen ligase family protein [Aliarcobacter skirrowii]
MNYLKVSSISKNFYEDYINYLILLYAFCLPISRAGVSLSVILIFLFWIFQANFKRKFYEIKQNYFILLIFIFIIYSFIAILWSSDKFFAIEYVQKYYHFLIIPMIFTSLKREYIDKVFSAFLLGMLISEITSYGIFFELWTKEGVSPNDPSPFMDHSNYSTYLAFTVFILMHKIIYTYDLKWKFAYSVFFLFSASNLFLNGGRTGQFSFMIALCIIGFLNFKNKIKATILCLILGATIFVSAYNISPIFKDRFDYFLHDVEVMINEKDFSNSFSLRVALWIAGIEASKDNLIFGVGIGDEAINASNGIEKFKIPEYFVNEQYIDFHNMFVQYLVQLGIIGLIIIISIFYLLIKTNLKDKVYRNLLIVFLILYFCHSILGNSFHINSSMIIFSLFSSVFITIYKYQERNN